MLFFSNILLFLAIFILLLYIYFTRNANYWKLRGVPHEKPIFFFGNLLDIALGKVSAAKYIANLYNNFAGPYFGIFALDQPWLVLKDPDLIKRVLVKDFQAFQNRFFLSDEKIDPLTCGSLFAIRRPNWKPLRVKLTPVFTSGKMKAMLNLIKECAENLERYVGTVADKDIEVKEIAAKYTTDVITTCAFGIRANSFQHENSEFRKMGRRMFERSRAENLKTLSYTFAPALVKMFRYKFIAKEPEDFLRRAFVEAINLRRAEKNKRNDLVDVLLDLKNHEADGEEFKFDDDRLVAQAIIFFTGGYETTSLTISFTLHELCINTEVQGRLRKEIQETVAKHGDVTYEAVQDMKYLHMVVSETLRKYPPIPLLFRECLENYEILETGLIIPKGTDIVIPSHALHKDPKHFPNPEKYDPERFRDENKSNITPYVYLPFGDGPRNCIAERFGLLSAKLSLIYILRSFAVERNVSTRQSLRFVSTTLLQPEGGVRMTFRKL